MKVTIDQLIERLQVAKQKLGGESVVLFYPESFKNHTITPHFLVEPIEYFAGRDEKKNNLQIPLTEATVMF